MSMRTLERVECSGCGQEWHTMDCGGCGDEVVRRYIAEADVMLLREALSSALGYVAEDAPCDDQALRICTRGREALGGERV